MLVVKRIMRKIIAYILMIISVLCILLGIFWAMDSGDSVKETINRSRTIQESFEHAAKFVDAYKTENGVLPTSGMFQEWASKFSNKPYSINGMQLYTSNYPNEIIDEFGSAPQGEYAIWMWRGEWAEYYVSWLRKSSLVFDESAYYMLGGPIMDGFGFSLLGVIFLFTAYFVWPGRLTNNASGTSASQPPLH